MVGVGVGMVVGVVGPEPVAAAGQLSLVGTEVLLRVVGVGQVG